MKLRDEIQLKLSLNDIKEIIKALNKDELRTLELDLKELIAQVEEKQYKLSVAKTINVI